MTYSVWNYRTQRYDYYRSPLGNDGTHAAAPPSRGVGSELGASPDQALWALPAGAVRIGSGLEARGKLASRAERQRSGGAIFGLGAYESHDGVVLGLAAALAAIVWRITR